MRGFTEWRAFITGMGSGIAIWGMCRFAGRTEILLSGLENIWWICPVRQHIESVRAKLFAGKTGIVHWSYTQRGSGVIWS